MIAPRHDNTRSNRYLVTALDHGVTQFAHATMVFVKTGVWHAHRGETQILFVLKGKAEFQLGRQAWRLAPGVRCVLPRDQDHRPVPLPGYEHMEFLDLRIATAPPTSLSRYVETLPAGISSVRPQALREIASRITTRIEGGGRLGDATLMASIWPLLALYEATAEPAPPESQPADVRLNYADVLMRDHLEQPLSIETLAARVNLSTSRLRQLMLQYHGTTPQDRYLQLRMEKARHFIESSTLSIKEIALRCSFPNADYFSRAFGAWAGATPTQVRRAAQTGRRVDG